MKMTFPYKLIDLTHTLESSTPAWDDGCGFRHDMQIDYADCKDGVKFRVMGISMNAGIGTHIDAPSHCIEDGKYIHEYDVNDLCMPCVVIDVTDKCHPLYSVTLEDISDFESKFGSIAKGSCVLIKTGWSKYWSDPEKYRNQHVFPSISPEVATLLLERGVSALGIDTLSPDRPQDGFNVHQIFLSAGKILIENVANLNSMPTVGGFIMALPIKIKDGTEAPVRLIGLIEKNSQQSLGINGSIETRNHLY